MLECYGIIIGEYTPGIYLIDRYKLAGKAGSAEQTGFTHMNVKTVNGKIKLFKLDIYIHMGLPELTFVMTAAHELMHVWLKLNAPLAGNKAIIEGSCNYAAYLILKETNTKISNYLINGMMELKDKFYGKGFRKVMQYVHSRGVKGWLSALIKQGKI